MIDRRERLRKFAMTAGEGLGLSRLLARRFEGLGAILMLHSVTAEGRPGRIFNDHLRVTPTFLDDVLTEARRQGLTLVTMDEMLDHLRKPGRGRAVAVTFDDAYRDNVDEALPVLESHAAPFTCYVAPGLIDGDIQPWWEVLEELVLSHVAIERPEAIGAKPLAADAPAAKAAAFETLSAQLSAEVDEMDRQALLDQMGGRDVATSPFLDWTQLRDLSRHGLATIGAHTIGHYNLARLDSADALDEMTRSAAILSERLGTLPRHFAYPYGHERAVTERERALAVEAGFASAVTTRHGTLQSEHSRHLHALPRISLNGRYQKLRFVRAMLSGFTTFANGARRVVTL